VSIYTDLGSDSSSTNTTPNALLSTVELDENKLYIERGVISLMAKAFGLHNLRPIFIS